MKLLIIGVNGRVGSLVAKDALSRGLEVTGLGKGENSLHLQNYVQKDTLELIKEEVFYYDVVIDAVRKGLKHLKQREKIFIDDFNEIFEDIFFLLMNCDNRMHFLSSIIK